MFPDQNYPTAYIDSLPGYNSSAGVDSMLDLAREIINNDNYYWQGVAFPTGGDILIPAGQTFVGNVSVEPLSFLTSITSFCSIGVAGMFGFKLRIYDKGGKVDIVNRQFTWGELYSSNMEEVFRPAATPIDIPFGPYMLTSPMVILHPGSLQVEITNLSAAAATIQIMMSMAFPITDRSLNIKDIKG